MPTIFETITSDPQFSLLAGLIATVDEQTGADLASTLNSPILGATIFAPTNQAIVNTANLLGYPDPDISGASTYLTAALNALSDGNPGPLLAQILAVHVVPDVLSEADLADPNTTSLTTLLGASLGVSGGTLVDLDPDNPDANIGAFTAASNGNVFAIDQLLLPDDIDVDQTGTPDPDLVIGTGGDDAYDLLASADVTGAGAGNDTIFGGDGNDLIHGAAGDDDIFGGAGDDRLEGQTGNDLIWGGDGDDVITGDQGDDLLNGGAGDDFVQGGSGDDRIAGNSGDDKLVGGRGNDYMLGRDGNDEMDGGEDEDIMFGGEGDDHMFGGANDDKLWGGSGDDFVAGGVGNDRVAGNSGDDYVKGNTGDDILVGGEGNDTYEGNEGADKFAFDYEDGHNVVVDFTAGDDLFWFGDLEEGQTLSFTAGQGDGDDLLITSSVNENWSVLVLDTEEITEDDYLFA